jgi:hypothetical protein
MSSNPSNSELEMLLDVEIQNKFEELYNAAGQPEELGEDFMKQYFDALKSTCSALASTSTNVDEDLTSNWKIPIFSLFDSIYLSKPDGGVIMVDIQHPILARVVRFRVGDESPERGECWPLEPLVAPVDFYWFRLYE